MVALLAEGVDRNYYDPMLANLGEQVALLAEGVDRNKEVAFAEYNKGQVALLAEGVDRNKSISGYTQQQKQSPSSRRAWIEIQK